MSRRTKDERRDDYLDIGAALVAESSLSGGTDAGLALAHVKLADVADRAGVTKGALYHIWPSQEAFWRDLLQHLLDTNRLFGAEQLAAIGTELSEASSTRPTLRTYSNTLFDSLANDPTFFARISLFSYLQDDAVRSSLDADFRQSVEFGLPVLEHAITTMGRTVSGPEALRALAVSVSALLEGLSLQRQIDPARTPDLPIGKDAERWSLFAAAAEALLVAYTQPAVSDTVESAVG
ncbi:MAG: TetR/AcrR family transcriptional regulator [Actinomycetota bacterium]|nr:TetR/AcrR family transcriptional regulator [Actinomycetota bacterium]